MNLENIAAAAAKSLQSCPTLCDPTNGSPPGSPVPGILQARTLEWVAISFSNAGNWKVKVKSLSRARLLATSWTAAYQAPPSMGFSRQEYWSGVPLPWNKPDTENQILHDLTYMWVRKKLEKIEFTITELNNGYWRLGVGGKRDILIKRYKLLVTRLLNSGHLKYSIVTIVNNNAHLKFANTVDVNTHRVTLWADGYVKKKKWRGTAPQKPLLILSSFLLRL